PPAMFRARWFGFLIVPEAASYTFATTSRDSSRIAIDGHRIVDNDGPHPVRTRSGSMWLNRGAHAVFIDCVQSEPPFEMNWPWAREGQPLSEVPPWRLAPRRVADWRITAARALDWAWFGSLGLCALGGALLAQRSWRGIAGTVREWPRTTVLALFVALA